MKYLKNTFMTIIALALVAFASGCADDSQESSNNASSVGHHH